MPSELERSIDQGSGKEPADIVLKGGRFFDLVSGELVAGDVALCGDRIVGTCGSYQGKVEIPVSGRILVPGFIDTHLHIESSMVTPLEFDRCILPRGVTTAICDPHEIANVLGAEGIRYFLDCAEQTIMDVRVQLSSCVPATHLETSGASLDINDLSAFRSHPKVIGLAEFMNYPGVLAKDPTCLTKLEAFQDGHIDGHAPLLRGKRLNGYLAAGISTDHETTTAEEAREKLSKGMHILVREGSVCKDLDSLIPIITERHSAFIALCTDDRNPLDIAEHGHLDYMIRHAISKGVSPLAIYRAASISGARAFGFRRRGLIAPGWRADIVVLDSLEGCHAEKVISAGRLVTPDLFDGRKAVEPVGCQSIKLKSIDVSDLAVSAARELAVIGVMPGKIITESLRTRLPQSDGRTLVDTEKDIIKVAVIERHGRNGNVSVGFVKGFGLKRGAIASTVGHDCHNICAVGVDDADMVTAVKRLAKIEGGFVVVANGEVLAEIALPVAGLMSLESYETVRDRLGLLRTAARQIGSTLQEPFLQIAFLPLPVIPHLKITDRGLVDVNRFDFVA
jgi:adenine deaminase